MNTALPNKTSARGRVVGHVVGSCLPRPDRDGVGVLKGTPDHVPRQDWQSTTYPEAGGSAKVKERITATPRRCKRRSVPRCPSCHEFADGEVLCEGVRYCVACGVNLDAPDAPRIDWSAPRQLIHHQLVKRNEPHVFAGNSGESCHVKQPPCYGGASDRPGIVQVGSTVGSSPQVADAPGGVFPPALRCPPAARVLRLMARGIPTGTPQSERATAQARGKPNTSANISGSVGEVRSQIAKAAARLKAGKANPGQISAQGKTRNQVAAAALMQEGRR